MPITRHDLRRASLCTARRAAADNFNIFALKDRTTVTVAENHSVKVYINVLEWCREHRLCQQCLGLIRATAGRNVREENICVCKVNAGSRGPRPGDKRQAREAFTERCKKRQEAHSSLWPTAR